VRRISRLMGLGFWLLALAALLPMASAQWMAARLVRSASVFRLFVADLWRTEFRKRSAPGARATPPGRAAGRTQARMATPTPRQAYRRRKSATRP